MRVTRGHLLLVFGLLAGGSGLAVILTPEVLPPEVRRFHGALDAQLVSRFAIGLAVVVVLVAVFRLLRPGAEQVDRSPIARNPPELVTGHDAAEPDRQPRLNYRRALAHFESPDHSVRLVAIYGRRAQSAIAVDEDIEQYFQELAEIVVKTYARSVGCDEPTAARAVETGQWTDDRIAGAFLATDPDSEVSFTAWERFTAWLVPERVFRSRVRRVLDEAEEYAGSYLTYGGTVRGPVQTRAPTEDKAAEQPAARTDSREGPNTRADGGQQTGRQDASDRGGETR